MSNSFPGTSSRTERINLRATKQEVHLLRQAAAVASVTLTAFIVSTAIREATLILGRSTAQDE